MQGDPATAARFQPFLVHETPRPLDACNDMRVKSPPMRRSTALATLALLGVFVGILFAPVASAAYICDSLGHIVEVDPTVFPDASELPPETCPDDPGVGDPDEDVPMPDDPTGFILEDRDGFVAFSHLSDGGVDEAWVNEMNQASYWNNRFGGTCTKFENHSGFIPAEYEAAVIKDGNMVRIYADLGNVGAFTALGAVNPANGQHFPAPHSWVMKCNIDSSTTTSTSTTTTTTSTTTTVPSSSTTTTPQTTSSTIGDSSTTTTLPSTTSSLATTTTAPIESTTTPTVAPTATPTDSTLPFTGTDGRLVGLGASALALGALLLFAVRREDT